LPVSTLGPFAASSTASASESARLLAVLASVLYSVWITKSPYSSLT
jgi:hypothetical protein